MADLFANNFSALYHQPVRSWLLILVLIAGAVFLPTRAEGWFELAPPLTASSQGRPRVASDGVNFLSAWMEADFAGNSLRAAIFTAGGDRIALVDVPFSMRYPAPVSEPSPANPPVVAYGGGMYAVVWSWRDAIYAVRVTTTGVLLDLEPLILTTGLQMTNSAEPYFVVASNGRSFLAVWTSAQRFERAMIPLHGMPEIATPVRSGPAPERGATLGIGCCGLASDGESYLILWTAREYYPGEYFDQELERRVEVISIDAAGVPRTPGPAVALTDAFGGPLAWSGHDFAYVTNGPTGRSLTLRRLDRDGKLLGEQALWFGTSGWPSALTVAGRDYFVAYQTGAHVSLPRNHIARLGPDGSLRHYAYGGIVPPYSTSSADISANVAGDVVVVVNAVPPGETGSNPRVIVYTNDDFMLQPPARSRAVRR